MSSLKELKNLKGPNKFLVFGYIRKIEQQSNLATIPLLIFYNILGYFYLNEYFSKCGDEIEISDDRKTITKTKSLGNGYWRNNSYGNLWFASNGNEIATWKFRINRIKIDSSGFNEIYFVFSSKDHRLNEDANDTDDIPNYGCSNCGELTSHGQGIGNNDHYDDSMHDKDDVISITLNTKKGEILFDFIENGDTAAKYTGIEQDANIKYKLAVSLSSVKNSITLVDFKCFNAP